jgi:hypothetical protein
VEEQLLEKQLQLLEEEVLMGQEVSFYWEICIFRIA